MKEVSVTKERRYRDVAFSPIEYMNECARDKKHIIDLGQGEPRMKTPKRIVNAGIKALQSGKTYYTSSRGILELRKKIAEKLKKDNKINAIPEEIICTVGVSEGLSSTILALIDKNDEVIIPTPSHPSFKNNVLLAGGKVKEIPCNDNFSLDIHSIENNIGKRTKAIIINTPNNPTGKIYSVNELKSLADIADRYDLLIISDEIYEKITYGKKHISIGRFTDRVITISGFSKSYAMTGWRIGYVHAKKNIIERILKIHNLLVICVPSFVQYAALSAFNVKKVNDIHIYHKKRDIMVKALNRIGLKTSLPDGGYYLFSQINKNIKSMEFSTILLEKYSILTIPGISFGMDWDKWVRFCFSYATINEINTAIEKIKKMYANC